MIMIARGNIPEAINFNAVVVIGVFIGLGALLYAFVREGSFAGSVKRLHSLYRPIAAMPIGGQLLIFAGWWIWNIGRW